MLLLRTVSQVTQIDDFDQFEIVTTAELRTAAGNTTSNEEGSFFAIRGRRRVAMKDVPGLAMAMTALCKPPLAFFYSEKNAQAALDKIAAGLQGETGLIDVRELDQADKPAEAGEREMRPIDFDLPPISQPMPGMQVDGVDYVPLGDYTTPTVQPHRMIPNVGAEQSRRFMTAQQVQARWAGGLEAAELMRRQVTRTAMMARPADPTSEVQCRETPLARVGQPIDAEALAATAAPRPQPRPSGLLNLFSRQEEG